MLYLILTYILDTNYVSTVVYFYLLCFLIFSDECIHRVNY